MMTRLIRMAAAALLCVAAYDVTALTLDATDGDITYTDKETFAAAATVEKIGSHKATLNFGTDSPTFAGTIEVKAGTLAVNNVNNLGKPTKITVTDGATLDLSTGTARDAGSLNKTEIVIAGTGVNGVGAIYRQGDASNGINELFGTVTLADDAAIGSGCQVGFSTSVTAKINLNGHTLTYLGSGTLYLPYVQFLNGGSTDNPGHVVVAGGTIFLRYTAMSGGSAANTLTMKDGTTLKLRDMETKVGWKLIGKGAFKMVTDGDNNSAYNVWAGPVDLQNGQLTLIAKSPTAGKSYLTVSGNISGNGQTIAIADTSSAVSKTYKWGTVTLSGTNDCGQLTVLEGLLQFVGGKLTHDGAFKFTGGKLRFADEDVVFNHTTSTALEINGDSFADVPTLVFDAGTRATSFLKDDGSFVPACKLYWGRSEGKCAFVEVKEGASVSNLTMAAGQNGIGGYWQSGGFVYWPTGNESWDAPGYSSTGYGFYALTGGEMVLDAAHNASFGMSGYAGVDVSGTGRWTTKSSERVWIGCGPGAMDWRLRNGGVCTFDGALCFGGKGYEKQPASISLTVSGEGSKLSAVYVENWLTNDTANVVINVNDGGCLEPKYVYRVNGSDGLTGYYVNLNGGRIRRMEKAGSGDFESNNKNGLPVYTVYENGFTFETPDAYTAFHGSFVRPPETGKRIASIALPTDAGFAKEVYLGAPKVRIVGVGQGATAFAEFDPATFKVTGVTVTSPGWGYADGTTTVTMESADRTKTYACAVTLTDQPTTGKGFVKEGSARLDLYGVNTYLGPTEVKAGILGFENPDAAQGGLPAGSGIIVREGATLTFPSANVPVTVPFIEGVGRTSYGYVTVTESIRVKAAEVFAGKCFDVNRQLTVGANVVVDILDPEALASYEESGKAVVIKAGTSSGTLKCDKVPELRFAGQPPTGKLCDWKLRRKGNTLVLGCRTGSVLIFR